MATSAMATSAMATSAMATSATDTEKWKTGINATATDIKEVEAFVDWRLSIYKKKGWKGFDLWESFVDDFESFTKDILNDLGKDRLKKIRDYLRENGVYIRKEARKSIADGLLVAIHEPTPAQWPADDPIDDPTDGPIDDPTDYSSDDPINDPTNGPTDGPTDGPTQNPTHDPTDHPADDSTDHPTDDSTDHPTPVAFVPQQPTQQPTQQPAQQQYNPQQPGQQQQALPQPTPQQQLDLTANTDKPGVPACRIAVSNFGEDLSQLINKLQPSTVAKGEG